MPQGNFLKRQKVQKEDGTYLGPDDFHIGSEVTICGHTFHICGCDRFTRWFYEENGVVIEEVPRSSILAILSGAFGGLFPVPAAATSKYRYDFDFIRSTIYCIYIYIYDLVPHTHTLSLSMYAHIIPTLSMTIVAIPIDCTSRSIGSFKCLQVSSSGRGRRDSH